MGDRHRRWSQWDTWDDDRDVDDRHVEEAGQEDHAANHADEGGETWHAPMMGVDTTSED